MVPKGSSLHPLGMWWSWGRAPSDAGLLSPQGMGHHRVEGWDRHRLCCGSLPALCRVGSMLSTLTMGTSFRALDRAGLCN